MADPDEPAQAVNSGALPDNSRSRPRFRKRRAWSARLATIPQFFSFSWLYFLPLVSFLGIFGILIYVSQVPGEARWSIFATALGIGISAFLAGGLIGFLFGVPRTVQGPTAATGVTQYQGNTNLEQVSDWLTKIIVGVGLVQINRIVPGLQRFAQSLKAPLGGLSSSAAFGLGLVISQALLGFFYLYLWSRSLLARELKIYDTPEQQGLMEGDDQTEQPGSMNLGGRGRGQS